MGQEFEIPEIIRKMLDKSAKGEIDPGALQGTLMRGMNFGQLLFQAFAPEQPVAWINAFMPPELVFGCGYIPFWLDGVSGLAAWIEMQEMFDSADATLPSRDLCTFLRATTGGAAMGLFPEPNVVACTSHLCEGAPKVARIQAERFGVEFHPLDVPASLSDEAVLYVARQLETLAKRLCELSGSKLDIDRMRETLDLSNRTRRSFLEINEMRKRVPAPSTGSQFIALGLVYPWGTKEGVEIAEAFRDELACRIADNIPALEGGEKYRLLWIHLRPVFESDILVHLERELRAVITVDVLGEASWPELDTEDPFRALAIKMLSNPQLAPMEAKIDRVLQLAREYKVDGVIHFLNWGCRWNYGQSSAYKEAINNVGLPFLTLDGDAVDRRATPYGQARTRLEGFVELLESAKSHRRHAV